VPRWRGTSRSFQREFHHYDLHAWLFKDNPLGMLAPTNPKVSCDDSSFAVLEQPTKMVDGPHHAAR
jgi:hypothetical protein